jgi:hypothetical protein
MRSLTSGMELQSEIQPNRTTDCVQMRRSGSRWQQVAADLLKKNVRQWETEVRNARAINGEAAQSPLANFHVPDLNLSPERNKNRHLKIKTTTRRRKRTNSRLCWPNCVWTRCSSHGTEPKASDPNLSR